MKTPLLIPVFLVSASLSVGETRDASINLYETPQPTFEEALVFSTAAIEKAGSHRFSCFLARSKSAKFKGGWIFHFTGKKNGITTVRVRNDKAVIRTGRTDITETPPSHPLEITDAYRAAKEALGELKESSVVTSAYILDKTWHFSFLTGSREKLMVEINSAGISRLKKEVTKSVEPGGSIDHFGCRRLCTPAANGK